MLKLIEDLKTKYSFKSDVTKGDVLLIATEGVGLQDISIQFALVTSVKPTDKCDERTKEAIFLLELIMLQKFPRRFIIELPMVCFDGHEIISFHHRQTWIAPFADVIGQQPQEKEPISFDIIDGGKNDNKDN